MSRAGESVRRVVRCAIYTRKSTEEGLDQAFNTLDAQREACEAYIKSQAGEGWRALPSRYDDGGYSGGNIERPGLKRLLADVEAGSVDTIVVYKVDRLTRSLMDFAKIVEKLDARSVSFVSVTQAFNTTTSMGRLTLNVLLSFAQFEREITGERIRDKVAASKAKGMWMGGNLPLGYDLGERVLIVNEVEARQVRSIFERYLQLGSVPALAKELLASGVLSKSWRARNHNERGGLPLRCGAIYYILQNRLYLGEIVHRGKSFRGDHTPIVSAELFEAVQQKLVEKRKVRPDRPARAAECLLLGRVYDADGQAMRLSFSYGRGGKCYRYYISAAGEGDGGGLLHRVAAKQLEGWVLQTVERLTSEAGRISLPVLDIVRRVEIHRRSTHLVLSAPALGEPHERHSSIATRLEARLTGSRVVSEDSDLIRLIADRRAVFRGGKSEGPLTTVAPRDGRLVEMLRSAHALLEQHSMSPLDPERYQEATAPEYQRLRRVMALGLLAPDVQREVLQGRRQFSADALTSEQLPLAWADQRTLTS